MKHKGNGKHIIAWMVAVCMALVMVPAASFAAVTGVTMDPTKATLESGEHIQLSAAVTVTGSEATTVKWTTTDAGIAQVDATGYVTAGSKEGTATITATSTADTSKSATCTVTVYGTALKVCTGTRTIPVTLASFHKGDLANMDSISVPAWGGYQHYFSYKGYAGSTGPAVKTILKEAGIDVDALSDDATISFIPSDDVGGNYTATFTVKELLRDARYYYPNAAKLEKGMQATADQKADAVKVESMIDTGTGKAATRLVLGQVGANERSVAVSTKNMTTGGKIIVSETPAAALSNDVTANISSGSTILPGTEIKLDSPSIFENEIYYTTNGVAPTKSDANLYNYKTKTNGPEDPVANATITAPTTEGSFTVKTLQTKYGKKDSAVKTFTYRVSTLPSANKVYKVGKAQYKVTKAAVTGGTVTFMKMNKKTYKTASVPKTVKIKGYTFKVNAINAKAFYKNKKLKTVSIGANVAKIGSKAFYGDKSLKSIKVYTKLLKKNRVGTNAFKGINKKAKIKVPKSKYKTYKKIFKGKPKTVKVVK